MMLLFGAAPKEHPSAKLRGKRLSPVQRAEIAIKSLSEVDRMVLFSKFRLREILSSVVDSNGKAIPIETAASRWCNSRRIMLRTLQGRKQARHLWIARIELSSYLVEIGYAVTEVASLLSRNPENIRLLVSIGNGDDGRPWKK